MTESNSSDTKPQPWYHTGLAFQCTQCGNCCTGEPGFVWVNEDELHAIAEYREVSYGEIVLEHTRIAKGARTLKDYPNGDCTFFDPATRRCTIYPVRPRQCRTWPFWNSHLESPAAWNGVKATCPGINCGDIVPLEEIQRRAAEIDL
jgi:uncharacterized protein